MDIAPLARADINLLVAFEALMQERNVTRAAARLALSQSAMSHTLRRLRDLFEDELFVRSGQKMVPTQRALEMAEPVRAALAKIGAVLEPALSFEPADLEATFVVSAFDFAQVLLLPAVAAALSARAPRARLVVRPYERDTARVLADGGADLVIGLLREPQEACQRVLSSEGFACALRRDHPCLSEGLSAERFAALPHAVVSPSGSPGGFVDAALAEQGMTRKVMFATPQLFSAALAVSQSDMVVTAAERHLRAIARLLPLAIVPAPVALPEFQMAMRWHERRAADVHHQFLREVVLEVAGELAEGRSPADALRKPLVLVKAEPQ